MMIDQKFPETRNTFDSPKKGNGGAPNPETQYLPEKQSNVLRHWLKIGIAMVQDGAPPYKLVYKPINYSYIYHKP